MSNKVEAGNFDYLNETLDVLGKPGLLLVSTDADGKPNAMTIGWGTVGIIWGKPIFVVLVRPSRYTYGLMEQTEDFTVNVPSAELREAVAFCGSKSGRDYDKFAAVLAEVCYELARSVVVDGEGGTHLHDIEGPLVPLGHALLSPVEVPRPGQVRRAVPAVISKNARSREAHDQQKH